jgi:hypothetical protein|tara:strand:- start:1123 stop:1302 length:180 start_codon:yes stop_codon:yes gene_type:complete
MKIFLTTFLHDAKEYEGPDIHAHDEDEALLIAESQGLILEGELTELYSLGDEIRPRVLH